MKRWHITAAALILVAAAVTVYLLAPAASGNLTEALGVNASGIDRVTVRSGSTSKLAVISGKENISSFFSYFSGVRLTKERTLEASTGYTFSAQLYHGDRRVASFTFGGASVIVPATDGRSTEYTASKPFDDGAINQKYDLN
jgi:hypothetical protein